MRFIKLFLISAIVLFFVVTVFSFIFPSHIRISRAVNMGVPREKVRAAISDLRTWDQWNAFIRSSSLTNKTELLNKVLLGEIA